MEHQLTFTIQETAAKMDISPHTLRYYERIGLLSPVNRADNGHRRYTEQDLNRLYFIQKMRATGMPISQLQAYIRLYEQGDPSRPQRLAMLCRHREAVQAQLDELQELLVFIDYKIAMYQPQEETT